MARAHRVVVLTLVMFAIIGLACAAEKIAPAPGTSAEEVGDDYSINAAPASSKGNGPTAAPGPPAGALDSTAAAPAPTAAAAAAVSSLHHFSVVAGAASAALAGFFYF